MALRGQSETAGSDVSRFARVLLQAELEVGDRCRQLQISLCIYVNVLCTGERPDGIAGAQAVIVRATQQSAGFFAKRSRHEWGRSQRLR